MGSSMGRPGRVAYSIYQVLLQVGVARPSDISKVTGIPLRNVISALETLRRKGIVRRRRTRSGSYYILEKRVWVG